MREPQSKHRLTASALHSPALAEQTLLAEGVGFEPTVR
jgi:hypothetical protein